MTRSTHLADKDEASLEEFRAECIDTRAFELFKNKVVNDQNTMQASCVHIVSNSDILDFEKCIGPKLKY